MRAATCTSSAPYAAGVRLAKSSAPSHLQAAADRHRRAPPAVRPGEDVLERARPSAAARSSSTHGPAGRAWRAPAAPRRAARPRRRRRRGSGRERVHEIARPFRSPAGRRRGSRRARRRGLRSASVWKRWVGMGEPDRATRTSLSRVRRSARLTWAGAPCRAVRAGSARRAAGRSGTGSIGPTTVMCRITPCLSTMKHALLHRRHRVMMEPAQEVPVHDVEPRAPDLGPGVAVGERVGEADQRGPGRLERAEVAEPVHGVEPLVGIADEGERRRRRRGRTCGRSRAGSARPG